MYQQGCVQIISDRNDERSRKSEENWQSILKELQITGRNGNAQWKSCQIFYKIARHV